MGRIRYILDFISHRAKSRRHDSFHSPYLFSLFTYACDDKIIFPLFQSIEGKRQEFLHSQEKLKRLDYGAGSQYHANGKGTTISRIAGTALSNSFQCRFLSRMARMATPNNVLELGTSLGISTSYLAAGALTAKITTVEGDPSIAKIASDLFQELGLNNVELVNKRFENFISEIKFQKQTIDFLFIDGNHRKDHLLNYYHSLKSLFHENTIVIVDDIYWSDDMKAGWKELIGLREITQSIDCFQFGVLFFNPQFLEKQNHSVYLPFKSVLAN